MNPPLPTPEERKARASRVIEARGGNLPAGVGLVDFRQPSRAALEVGRTLETRAREALNANRARGTGRKGRAVA
jgi:hypothetical protein